MASHLPPESGLPDVLYRVTSSKTFCLSFESFEFPSPAKYSEGPTERQLDLTSELQSLKAFEIAARCHLTAASTDPKGHDFFSPFISATTSFRYALSVAELTDQRGGGAVTIAVIDCKSLKTPKHVWNASAVAEQFSIAGKNGMKDFKNEYLIFEGLKGTSDNCVSVRYNDIKLHLAELMPALSTIKDLSRKRRFSDLFDDVPPSTSLPTAKDADAAWELSTRIAPQQTRLSVMTNLLLLQHREFMSDTKLHTTVAGLVFSKVDLMNTGLLRHFPEIASAYKRKTPFPIRDYLIPQYVPRTESTTPETLCSVWCLVLLTRALHGQQDHVFGKWFKGCSITAFWVRRYLLPEGSANTIVKLSDLDQTIDQVVSKAGAPELRDAFIDLRKAVKRLQTRLRALVPC